MERDSVRIGKRGVMPGTSGFRRAVRETIEGMMHE